MSKALVELDNFSRFVESHLQAQEATAMSLEQYWERWRAERDRSETLADIREAVAELEQGRGIPLQEAAEIVRQRLRQMEQTHTA